MDPSPLDLSASVSRRPGLRISLGVPLLSILALGLWLGDVADRARQKREIVARLEKMGGKASWDYSLSNDDTWISQPGRWEPAWLQHRLGPEYFHEIVSVYFYPSAHAERFTDLATLEHVRFLTLDITDITDDGLARVRHLKHLHRLWLDNTEIGDAGLVHLKGLAELNGLWLFSTQVTDEGLRHLRGLQTLRTLELGNVPITDAGLEHVAALKGLESLGLSSTKVTDAGLARLADMKDLGHLSLSDTAITDAGLVHLRPLKKLWIVYLTGTKVTPEGRAELLKTFPHLEIR